MGISHAIVNDISSLSAADRYILPGVGSFDFTMRQIRGSGLFDLLREHVHGRKKPILGICVGMQLLANTSEEGMEQGLGYIEGSVQRIRPKVKDVRLPHMGWNSVSVEHDPQGLFRGVDPATGFYFLHNYHFVPEHDADRMATTHYGEPITCAVSNNQNIFGVQFHPEKSHDNGIQLFRNFALL